MKEKKIARPGGIELFPVRAILVGISWFYVISLECVQFYLRTCIMGATHSYH